MPQWHTIEAQANSFHISKKDTAKLTKTRDFSFLETSLKKSKGYDIDYAS